MSSKNIAERRKNRVRFSVKKNNKNDRPRLSVHRTNQHTYAQVVCDIKGVTLAQASTVEADVAAGLKSKSNIEAAKKVGELVAKRAKAANVNEVVFDRGGYLFHGRIEALANAARAGGLNF
jgi:large subunit ribosomal protein L18